MKAKQKDVWEMIVDKHNAWTKPSYYNHVRDVVELIERDNDVKIPIEWVWKLDKRYQKWRA